MGHVIKGIKHVCPVHGEHNAVMWVTAKKSDDSHADAAGFCMFCLIEKLDGLGVRRMETQISLTQKPKADPT